MIMCAKWAVFSEPVTYDDVVCSEVAHYIYDDVVYSEVAHYIYDDVVCSEVVHYIYMMM